MTLFNVGAVVSGGRGASLEEVCSDDIAGAGVL